MFEGFEFPLILPTGLIFATIDCSACNWSLITPVIVSLCIVRKERSRNILDTRFFDRIGRLSAYFPVYRPPSTSPRLLLPFSPTLVHCPAFNSCGNVFTSRRCLFRVSIAEGKIIPLSFLPIIPGAVLTPPFICAVSFHLFPTREPAVSRSYTGLRCKRLFCTGRCSRNFPPRS